MLLRAQRPRVLTLFGIFSLSAGGFYLSQWLEALFPWSAEGSLWGRVSLGATLVMGAVLPFTALSFFLEFLNFSPRTARLGRRMSLISVVLGLGVGVTPLAEQQWARIAVACWVLAALSFSFSLLLARMRRSESRIERARLMYLAIGAGAAVFFTALDFLPRFDVPFPAFLGPIISTLYLFFLSQTLLRLRLLDLHELLGKIAAQAVLASILALVFVALTSWVEGSKKSLFLFNTVVAAFVMLILLEPLRAKVDERVVAIFFRERFNFLQALRSLLSRTANIIDVPELTARLLDGLNETRRITHASVYLLAEDRPGYRLVDSRGPQPSLYLDAGSARTLLSRTEKAQLLETVERRILELRAQPAEARRSRDEVKRLNDVKSAMQQMKAGITVPLLGNDRVIGFLNLWDERVPESFASDEIALILELADHLGTVVENSKLYDRMRERDRLAALGEMSAGLAHEIRNPLGAIKGAAQCLDPHKLPGEDGEFLEVIVEEVNRLNGVVSEFLDYARPLKQNFGPTDVNEVVTRTVRLIQNDMPPNLTLKTELGDINKVDGDAEQLKQVLINLVQNARQAIGDKPGEVLIKTLKADRFSDFRAIEQVEIQVIDSGPGIPHDQQLNIFVPFFTTKQKGTGLGLAICQRIVKNHGGMIVVQSRQGEGSTFIVRLPSLAAEVVSETPLPGSTPSPQSQSAIVTRDDRKSRRDAKKKRKVS